MVVIVMKEDMRSRLSLEKYNYKKLGWLHDSIKFVVLFVVLFIIFRYIIGVSVVNGNSMDPTLKDGEWVVYLRTATNYQVGDVVCVWVPSGNYYVKRVVAVGGDTVEIEDGKLVVNGDDSDKYAVGATDEQESAVFYPYYIGEGNYFVLGDNREVSVDSRTFGEVSSLQVKGRIIFHFGGK